MIAPGERSSPSGQELLAEFVTYGRQRPFEEITRRYAGMVFNVCLRVTKDKHDAEDATQAVFLTLALKAKQGTEIKAIGPWLQQVAKRLSLDLRRGKKRRKTREERHEAEQTFRRESLASEALPTADLDELKIVLHEELHKLPAKYRIPLILHYFGGMNREEMAAELNCKPSTLGVRIFRGREMLAGRLSNRGVHMAAGAMAFLIGWAVKDSVYHGMVAGTSHAAAMMMAGHSGAGLASAQVVSLARSASGAMAVGKLKVGAAMFLLTGASLGAGHALGVIPSPAALLQRVVEAGVRQLLRPLNAPVFSPLRAGVTPPAAIPAAAVAIRPVVVALPVRVTPAAAEGGASATVAWVVPVTSSDPIASPTVTAGSAAAGGPGGSVSAIAAGVARLSTSAQPSVLGTVGPVARRTAGGDPGGGGTLRSAAPTFVADKTPAAAAAATPADNNLFVPPAPDVVAATTSTASAGESSTGGGGGGGAVTSFGSMVATPAASVATLAYGSTTFASSAADLTVSPASQVQIVQIPAGLGSLSEANGVLRGWGQVSRTGMIDLDGRVVADGDGHDRTLSLVGLTDVHTDDPNATAGNGWYAADHGRLTLPLRAAPNDPSVLTWGGDPNDGHLELVNSLRLTLLDPSVASGTGVATGTRTGAGTDDGTTMTADPLGLLSLLAVDRDDAPDLQQIDGATIGLWQVDPAAGDLAAADLSIRYDDALVDSLGGSESGVQLWTLDAAGGGSWQLVDPASFSVDTVDHIVSGTGDDFDYFAVAVAPAAGRDVGDLLAHPSAEPAGVAPVPEPAAVGLFGVAAVALLGRRQRRCRI